MSPAEESAEDRLERREALLSALPRPRRPVGREAVLRSTLAVVYARALRGPVPPAR